MLPEPAPSRYGSGMSVRLLDDPAWFGAVMGTGAMGAVAARNPGGIDALATPGKILGLILLGMAIATFVLLMARDVGLHRIGKSTIADIKAPISGPAYATIPGGISVIAVAIIAIFPDYTDTPIGWIVLACLTAFATAFGLWLTVIFFVATFEQNNFDAEDISGIWFIPETVVLLGALLTAHLAITGPDAAGRTLTIVAIALLGGGAILFAITAALFVNRLVLHAQVRRTGAPAMWIMLSPLSVTALAMHKVAGAGWNLAGDWEPAVQASADLLAAMMWGFALWWIAAAAIVTSHAGRGAFRFSPSAWSYVFPPAAMTLATLTLGRKWDSGFMEVMSVVFALVLLTITTAVVSGSIRAIRLDRKQDADNVAEHLQTD